jgi:hypothetical protein
MSISRIEPFQYVRIIFTFIIICISFQINSQNPIRVLPLGNSITQGEGSSVSNTGKTYNTWRRNLYKKLVDTSGYNVDFIGTLNQAYSCEDYPDSSFDPDHEGHWAWTIDEIVYGRSGTCNGEGRLGQWIKETGIPEIVLVHLGTNDCWAGQSVQSSVSDMENLIDSLRSYNPDIIILLAQIIGHKDNAVDQCIQELNDSISMIAERKTLSNSHIELVDQYTGFDPFQDCYDDAHPNESGESKIATKWFDAMLPFLESSSIQQIIPEEEIRIYPNPLRNGQTLTIENSWAEDITVCSLSGNLVKQYRIRNPRENKSFKLDRYSPGLYFIRIKTKTGYYFKQLIIQN